MPIMRFSPINDLLQLQDRMNRILGDLLPSSPRHEELFSEAWVPAVDIFENKNELVLKADLPEIEGKDVTIKVEDNVLTLSGERKMSSEVKQENYHRVERAYGSFARSFTLPHTVDREKIKAGFKDGVLTVILPKREENKPKEIKIEVG